MRNIPIVTKSLLIINVVAFLISMFSGHVALLGGRDMNDIFGLHFFLAPDFQIYQLITYMFMHGGWAHLFFNMFALWMFGCVVENVWGPKKFLFYYIFCGIGAGLCQEIAQYVQYAYEHLDSYEYVRTAVGSIPMSTYLNLWTTVGASGAIYAILLAFGMLFPEQRIFIIPIPFPIKAKWFVMIYVAIELFSAIGSSGDGVAHVAHLGGMLFGFLLIRYWKKHPYRSTVNFSDFRIFHTTTSTQPPHHESDWDYNKRKQTEQAEIDRILDKIRKSGYDSLSKSEKQKLFDSSKK
ncbi:MAG: rhomboid family intramembrane serine protease [Prevotella sp.]|jgi:membrane associated rhomboid family serine protease|nr:rhomboid family intramembrane serine protease [Prevotella sp.]MBR4368985.1 rhomboid family intramembrane serine protease [Prevotella sp.]MBR7048371.1 rhomboid family intramembrane serine protease [Prevotella sp.]